MKLPKSVPGVNRGMSALRGYYHQVGVEPSISFETCRWVGTGPFCSGQCAPGEYQKMRAGGIGNLGPDLAAGFGGFCLSGWA